MNVADDVKKEIVLTILLKIKEIKTSGKKRKVEEMKKEIKSKFLFTQFNLVFLEILIPSILGRFEVVLPDMIAIDYNFQNMFIKKASSSIKLKEKCDILKMFQKNKAK